MEEDVTLWIYLVYLIPCPQASPPPLSRHSTLHDRGSFAIALPLLSPLMNERSRVHCLDQYLPPTICFYSSLALFLLPFPLPHAHQFLSFETAPPLQVVQARLPAILLSQHCLLPLAARRSALTLASRLSTLDS